MKRVSFPRYALSAGVTAALLVACGGSQGIVNPGPLGQRDIGSRVVSERDCPTAHCIIVGDVAPGNASGSILFFPRNANGNVRPTGRIEGSPLFQHRVIPLDRT